MRFVAIIHNPNLARDGFENLLRDDQQSDEGDPVQSGLSTI